MTNLKLQTSRLIIIPLSISEVGLLTEDIAAFEAKLDLTYNGEPLGSHLLEVMKWQYKKMQAEPENYLWRTFWMFILENEKTIIGSAGFRGTPDSSGSVEIGYGINEEYRNLGYTSETIASICAWAIEQNGVNIITAETEKSHIASQRVLEKCGFRVKKEKAETFVWHLSAQN